jgi:predicted ATP-binding protein involved in virulence
MSTSYIKHIEIKKLWGKYDIVWDNLHPDVNILVGINGSGKSTLLKVIYAAISGDDKSISKYKFESARIKNQNNWHDIETTTKNKKIISGIGYADEFLMNYEFISTFDVALSDKKGLGQNESPLTNELKRIILEVGKGTNSFTEFRLLVTQAIEKANEINMQIDQFFKLIDNFFKNTGKKIAIDYSTNRIIFKSDKEIIEIEDLSSGEKQLLLILFKVFLMDKKPCVLLMDEPEISLHLSWQQDLIKTIRDLNPFCQLIIATHSPSIFGKGWGDKITFIEDLFTK